jgi:hypothetical protein
MGSFFSCYHNYNNGRFGFVFVLAAISTVGGGIYLCFLSRGAVMKRSNKSLTKDEISTFLSLLSLQAACPKAYKSTATNSFEIVVSLSM